MASNEQKALQLIAEAEKKISSKGFFASLFGASRIEDAVECYQRAGNLFKMAKNWEKAGRAFCEAGNLNCRNGARHDAAANYVNAANCYRKSDIDETVNCLLRAIEIYTDLGRFTMAAKQHESIAQMYETATIDLDRAVQHYEQAADYYRGEESISCANKCLLKVAQYAAQSEEYEKAIEIYQQFASQAVQNTLLKYSATEYLFKAALCHLCVDVTNAQQALARYIQMHPTFPDSREYKLLTTLIEHIEEQNVDGYTEAVAAYDSVSRLDPWYTTMLLRIKKQLNEKPDLR